MWNKRDTEQLGCKTGMMDAGKEGCRKGGMQERWDSRDKECRKEGIFRR